MAIVKAAREIGSEGLSAFYGQVSEAYLTRLQWPAVYAVYDEMRRRDPTLRGMINAVKLLARQSTWRGEPATDTPADREAAEFLDQCLDSMSHTVVDFIDDVMTFLPFGWSSFEQVYKRLDDGGVGWQKLAFRRQSTLDRWELDAGGGLQGWYQRAAPDYTEVFLPINKMLHFVGERDGGNPEGLALFESAYEPWYYVKNLQIINGIGWQRSFVGLPVFEFGENPSEADKSQVKAIGQGLAVDDRQYVSVPPKVVFDLKSVSNSNAASLLETIKFYRTLMLQMILADFIMLGTSSGTGSWALGTDKSELFIMSVNGYLDRIEAIWNRHGVKRLLELNPGLTGEARIVHAEVRKPNLGTLAAFISQIASHIQISDQDVAWIRDQAGMPDLVVSEDDDDVPPDDVDIPPPDEDNAPSPDGRAEPEVSAAEFFPGGDDELSAWRGYG